jgi:hypothetical protein
MKNEVKIPHVVKHESKRKVLRDFLIVLGIFTIYFVFVIGQYGLANGFLVSILTWSFIVFCTPVVGAGLLLDFPIRLLTQIRMIYSEIFVWIFAAILNISTLILNPGIYEKTILLQTFKIILTNPIPFWLIILISCAGTFLSVYFGDELLDIARLIHRKKWNRHGKKHIATIIIFILIVIMILTYTRLISMLGIQI